MNWESSFISLLLRQFNFTAAKGTLEGGRTYEEDTEIGGGGGEVWIPIAQGLPWTTDEPKVRVIL